MGQAYQVGYVYGSPRANTGGYGSLRPRRGGNVSPAWVWGCGFLSSLMCVGACLFALVLIPVGFRALPEDIQAGIARRIPIMVAFLPGTATPDPTITALEVVPTLDPARATAAAQLFGGQGAPALGSSPFPTPIPSNNLRATALLGPTVAPTITPTRRPTATAEALPVRFHVGNIQREPQAFNNCGPANLVQAFRVVGVPLNQKTAAGWLKPTEKDANVSPWQMAAYTNDHSGSGLRAIVRVNGTIDLMKRLTYNGFGVVAETGLYHPQDRQWLGHYITLVGWDDVGDAGKGGYLYGLDSFESNGPDGKGIHEYYADFDERWKHFNRLYIVVYRPEQEGKLRALMGDDFEERLNIEGALIRAFGETKLNPADPFAWFNVGTNYVMLGNYEQAARAYDLSRSVGGGWPWRMMWYQFGPYKAYFETGDYKSIIDLSNAVIKRMPTIEESFYYRGLAYAAQGDRAKAEADLQVAVKVNTNFDPAAIALAEVQSGNVPRPATL